MTSGRARSIHHASFSSRTFNELTFQVAMRMVTWLARQDVPEVGLALPLRARVAELARRGVEDAAQEAAQRRRLEVPDVPGDGFDRSVRGPEKVGGVLAPQPLNQAHGRGADDL